MWAASILEGSTSPSASNLADRSRREASEAYRTMKVGTGFLSRLRTAFFKEVLSMLPAASRTWFQHCSMKADSLAAFMASCGMAFSATGFRMRFAGAAAAAMDKWGIPIMAAPKTDPAASFRNPRRDISRAV